MDYLDEMSEEVDVHDGDHEGEDEDDDLRACPPLGGKLGQAVHRDRLLLPSPTRSFPTAFLVMMIMMTTMMKTKMIMMMATMVVMMMITHLCKAAHRDCRGRQTWHCRGVSAPLIKHCCSVMLCVGPFDKTLLFCYVMCRPL